jgi:hypothetical protein
MLDEKRDGMTPQSMIKAIRALPSQGKPSDAGADGLLDGLEDVIQRTRALMNSVPPSSDTQ